MQTANIMLALGGDKGNTVPKTDVTPSEIALLLAIHGNEAVFDIDPLPGEKLADNGSPITNRGELARLQAAYSGAKDSENVSHFDRLFPGIAARAFETIDELGLPESFFKPSGRVASKVDPLDHDGDGHKGGAAPSTETGLHGMTVAQLKALAATNKIDLGDATKKSDIIDAIEAATAEIEPVENEPGEGEMADNKPGAGDSLFK